MTVVSVEAAVAGNEALAEDADESESVEPHDTTADIIVKSVRQVMSFFILFFPFISHFYFVKVIPLFSGSESTFHIR